MTKDEYFRVFVNVGMVLRPGIEADDLQKIIKEDFDNDCLDRNPTLGSGGNEDEAQK